MVSEHNLLTVTRFHLPQGVLSLRGGGGGGGGGGIGEIWTSALGNTDLSSLSSALHMLSVTVFTPDVDDQQLDVSAFWNVLQPM